MLDNLPAWVTECAAEVALLMATTLQPSEAFPATITAYCLDGITATGLHTRPGIAAVDPSVIPLGSMIVVEGMGEYLAADTGGGVRGAHVDIWMADCADAIQWGRRERMVWIRSE